jgi:predicted signal transduction protein with EAL and GGDEF domain
MGVSGIAIVLDDFGIGCASVPSLRMRAFNNIKIDQSRVAKLIDRMESAAGVSTIINSDASRVLRPWPKGLVHSTGGDECC